MSVSCIVFLCLFPWIPRYAIMAYYILLACEPKKRLTLQNFNGLLKSGLVPQELNKQKQVLITNLYKP